MNRLNCVRAGFPRLVGAGQPRDLADDGDGGPLARLVAPGVDPRGQVCVAGPVAGRVVRDGATYGFAVDG